MLTVITAEISDANSGDASVRIVIHLRFGAHSRYNVLSEAMMYSLGGELPAARRVQRDGAVDRVLRPPQARGGSAPALGAHSLPSAHDGRRARELRHRVDPCAARVSDGRPQ